VEVEPVGVKVGGGEEGKERKRGENRRKKVGGERGKWGKRELRKLVFGQNGRGDK
jgi:hypothetical protein